MSVFYEVIPEFNQAGRLCNYHTGEDGETVRVAEEEWERFSQLAGRQHEIVGGFIIYNSNLEPCLPDISISQEQSQRLLLAEILGLDLPVETAAKATDILCLDLPGLPESKQTGEWKPGEQVKPGMERTYNGVTYVVREGKGHFTRTNWAPDIATSLWMVINTDNTGTLNDPIPAALNMMYYKDKYYVENSKIYRCTRDSGIPLAYLPSQLVGHYFELAK